MGLSYWVAKEQTTNSIQIWVARQHTTNSNAWLSCTPDCVGKVLCNYSCMYVVLVLALPLSLDCPHSQCNTVTRLFSMAEPTKTARLEDEAREYDILIEKTERPEDLHILDYLKPLEACKVVDTGCGPGNYTYRIADHERV